MCIDWDISCQIEYYCVAEGLHVHVQFLFNRDIYMSRFRLPAHKLIIEVPNKNCSQPQNVASKLTLDNQIKKIISFA